MAFMPIGSSFRHKDEDEAAWVAYWQTHNQEKTMEPVIATNVLTPKQIFEAVKAKRTAVQEECEKAAKDFFRDEAKKLFEQHPAMTSFRWNQYTPFWNDGDTCYFRVYRDYVWINDGEEETNGTQYNRALKKSEP